MTADPGARSAIRKAIAVAVGTRVIVLAVGLATVLTVGYELKPFQFRLSHNELWNLPGRFDAGWYLGIARRGYRYDSSLVDRQQNVAFFPGFPIAMRYAGHLLTIPAHLTNNPYLFGNGDTRLVWGGTLFSIACFIVASVLLVRLAEVRLGGADVGVRGMLLLATFPFAFFFSAPYSEAMFLMCAAGTFLALERTQPWRAACWALVAGLTRSNGWTLSVAMLLLVCRSTDLRRKPGAWVAMLAPIAAVGLFSWYLWTLWGNPNAWADAQRGWGREMNPIGFVQHRVAAIHDLGLAEYLRRDPTDPFTILAAVFSLVMVWPALRQLGPAYAAFSVAYLVPAVVIDTPSVGRMTSVLFPSFLTLAIMLNPARTLAVAIVFLSLQLWMAARFFTWHTPY
jgi:Mannosyltransferase (PIG-V)